MEPLLPLFVSTKSSTNLFKLLPPSFEDSHENRGDSLRGIRTDSVREFSRNFLVSRSYLPFDDVVVASERENRLGFLANVRTRITSAGCRCRNSCRNHQPSGIVALREIEWDLTNN